MREYTLSLADIDNQFTIQTLETFLGQVDNLELLAPCPMFGSANSNIDIANDYLFALFLGESIASHCNNISCKETRRSISFKFNPKFADTLAGILFQFCRAFNNEWEIDFENSIMEFSFSLDKQIRFFPELADAYMANIVAGQGDIYDSDLDQDALQSLYASCPEREFGFWRSFISHDIGCDLFTSSWAWILPHQSKTSNTTINIKDLLVSYAGFNKGIPDLEEAERLCIGDLPPVVINNSVMMLFPRHGLYLAQECALKIRSKDHNQYTPYHRNFAEGIPDSLAMHRRDQYPSTNITQNTSLKVLLSEDGTIMIASDELAQYIFFKDYKYLSETELTLKPIEHNIEKKYQGEFDKLAEHFSSLAGYSIHIDCPWHQIDDEQFEQLCYDLIEYATNFDPDTRQKFGKSRSRDGGRDIEVHTRKLPNTPSVKWIVQCKKLPRGATLGTKVQVSDVIDQYGAGGFWIMTSGVIDGGLHDKLEGIARNRKIGIEKWDYLKIERILAKPKYRNIRKRYFDF